MKKARKIEKPKAPEKGMKRCWIHVGMHKTGSSSIQANLSRVENPQDWCYLKVGNSANMGGSMQAMFGSKPENFYLFARRGETAEQIAKKRELMRRQLELIIRKSKAGNLILSAENLSIMNKEEIASLRDFLLPLVDEIRVIAYVRPHGGFRMSWFQQLVKHGKSNFDIDKVKPNYRKRFSKFDEIFGAKNVKLRLFDSSSLKGGCIVADFCSQIGITPPNPNQVTRVNESLTREACGMLYAYRKFGPGFGVGKTVLAENSQLIEPMLAMKGTKFRLAESVLAPGRVNDASDIAWMEQRLKSSLEEPWKSDGTEVASEDDLLQIGRNACIAYLEKFREIHGIEVSDEILPAGDMGPIQVAEMLEHCREQLRRRMAEAQALKKSLAVKKRGGKPSKRCWIHVGMHKTGTASIQASLGRVKHPVGWRYLNVGKSANMGKALYAMFGNNPQDFHLYAKRGDTPEQLAKKREALRRQFEQMIRKSKENTLILSAETLSIMDKSEIEALRDFLTPLVDDVRVVAYVRSSPGFRSSWFQQTVKHGSGEFKIGKIRPQYRKRFKKFDEIFGIENVKLRLFSPAALTKGCIVTDFCGQIGITPPDPESITRVDQGLTREACGILYAYRKFGPGFGGGRTVLTENKRLIQPLLEMTGTKFRLAESCLAPGSANHTKDIAWMEMRLGISLAEEWQTNGTEVTSEEELLNISRNSCAQYLLKFKEIHGIEVPDDILPAGDPIMPVEVAVMVERCRDLIRAELKANHAVKGKSAPVVVEAKPVKRCWIHVGMHKTGSTSIQMGLSRMEQPPGWRYLMVGGKPNMGQAIYTMFGTNPENFIWFAKRGMTAEQLAKKGEALRAEMERVIRNCGAENIVISSETLSIMDKHEIASLRDFLVPLIEEICIVGYVRPPVGFRTAWFQQRVKHGWSEFDIEKVRPRYRKRFEKFDQLFGRKNVKLCLFKPAALANGCVVADFCEQIGMPAPAPGSIVRANESLSRDALRILFAYRKYGSGYGVGSKVISENTKLIQAMQAMKGSKFLLADSLLAKALPKHANDIGWMERRLKTGLTEESQANGTEITSEDDLLRIPRSACAEFLKNMHEIHGIEVSEKLISVDDPQDPVKVAELVDLCRSLIRDSMNEQPVVVPNAIEPVKGKRHLVSPLVKKTIQDHGKTKSAHDEKNRQLSRTHSNNDTGTGDEKSV